ncbi:MAG: hypothetical protein WAU15_05995 [Nitrosomonas sp.]
MQIKALSTEELIELRSQSVNAFEYLGTAYSSLTPNDLQQLKARILNRTSQDNLSKCLKEAADLAVAEQKALFIPAGLWPIQSAEVREGEGWMIDVLPGGNLLIFGEAGTHIQRLPVNQVTNTFKGAALIWIAHRPSGIVRFQNLLIDGNESTCPIDPNNDAAYEHAANIKFFPQGNDDAEFEGILLHGVTMTGCVADGLNINLPTRQLLVHESECYGRTRRFRSDITLSLVPSVITDMNNFIGDSFEVESKGDPTRPAGPIRAVNKNHLIKLTNVLLRGALDLDGKEGTLNVIGERIRQLGSTDVKINAASFYNVRGFFSDCHFVNVDQISKCDASFLRTKFTVYENPQIPGEAKAISIAYQQEKIVAWPSHIKFVDCHFSAVPEVTSGCYIKNAAATNDVTQGASFIDCRNDKTLSHFAQVDRCGTFIFHGGILSGQSAVIGIAHGNNNYVTHIIIKDPFEWLSPLMMINNISDSPLNKAVIGMEGKVKQDTVLATLANPRNISPNIEWHGGFVMYLEDIDDPNGRIVGIPNLKIYADRSSAISAWIYDGGANGNEIGRTSYHSL